MTTDSPDLLPACLTVAAAPAAARERRAGGKRHRSVLLVGRVVGRAGSPACLVHDLSRSGMMARFTDPPAVGETLVVEVRGLPPVTGTVRWVKGTKAGLEFAEAQDLDPVFHPHRDDGTVARAPRFPVSMPGELKVAGTRRVVELLDISAGGAKLAIDPGTVTAGQAGAIHLSALRDPIYGTLCWVRDDHAGFRFAAPLPLGLLAELIGG